jgi:pimeloyl-ACP methyl ester carboxylesterase
VSSDNVSQFPHDGRLITAGGRRIRLYEEGSGSPAIVIVAGAGDCADSWVPIRHQLAAAYRVLSYDRAGIGGSQEDAPATVDRYLAELDAVVRAAAPQGQVVLAGHSLGGLIARLYQQANPDWVSGLVLLDSTPEPVADDRGVQAGFIASSITAAVQAADPARVHPLPAQDGEDAPVPGAGPVQGGRLRRRI